MKQPTDELPVIESQEELDSLKPSSTPANTSSCPSNQEDLQPSASAPVEDVVSTEVLPSLQSPDIEPDDDATLVEGQENEDDDDDRISTISLKSSVTSYKYENGRRYHAQDTAQYFLPNDERENDRLDFCHHMLTLRLDDKLHLAPIGPEPHRILDLGTGTGIWAMQMGDAYPSSTIVGNDLSPVQPNIVPPNVIFEVDDIEAEWCFSRPFDYIHCRYLAGAIGDWPRLMKQAFKYTKPGGWVEFQDFDMRFYSNDGTFDRNSSAQEWSDEIIMALKEMDREPEPGPKLERWVREAGFENVNSVILPIPVGLWPKDKRLKEIGACDLSMFLQGLEGISLRALINGRNWTGNEVLAFLPAVRKDLNNKCVHAQHNFYVVWAQKPLENAES